jgi:hypothetical protein
LKDPFDNLNSAKRILMDKTIYSYTKNSILCLYDRNLLRIDYRLACLRYSVNIEPVDDFWYQFSQDFSTFTPNYDMNEIYFRIKKVVQAINYAKILANDLDERFKCTFRMEEILKREERLNEITSNLKNSLV